MSEAHNEIFTPDYTPPKRERKTRVSWALKHWNKFTEEDKRGLAEHMKTLTPDQAVEYRKYLAHFCGVPKELV